MIGKISLNANQLHKIIPNVVLDVALKLFKIYPIIFTGDKDKCNWYYFWHLKIFIFMFEQNSSRLGFLAVHYVGNKLKDEELRISQQESGLDEPTLAIVWQYVFSAFKTPDFYRFTHPADLEMNNVFKIAQSVFEQQENFVEKSGQLAKLLYDASQHPQVKSGELLVLYFHKLKFDHVEAPALGLFKSEQKQPFLFTEEQNTVIDLFSYKGISPTKVDKAALIFNVDAEDGYQVLCVDNLNKGEETKFWFDDFLKVKLRSTQFSQTSALIGATKNFIDQDLKGEKVLERNEVLELIGRSKEYFEESESYNPEAYGQQVFEDETVANRFREYVALTDSEDLKLSEDFDLSREAIKKKQSVFKSILKLDKNFSVYIHGNRQMIEKGTDDAGRKFYKLFYEEEK